MLGSLLIYLKGMRRMMFQLSGFYCKALVALRVGGEGLRDCGLAGFWLHDYSFHALLVLSLGSGI